MEVQIRDFSGSEPSSRPCLAERLAISRAETRLMKPKRHLSSATARATTQSTAQACTWPCSITQMDASDQMDQVYEALVHWADAIIIATPIRWGAASSLYFKMAERLNCVQNAVTVRNQRSYSQQGCRIYRRRRTGRRPSGRRPDAGFLRGAWLYFSPNFLTLPIHAVGRTKIWNAMSRSCAPLKELAEGAAMLTQRCLDLAAHLISRDEAPSINRTRRPQGTRHARLTRICQRANKGLISIQLRPTCSRL